MAGELDTIKAYARANTMSLVIGFALGVVIALLLI